MTKLDGIAQSFLGIWNKMSLPADGSIDLTKLSLEEAYAVQKMVIGDRIAS